MKLYSWNVNGLNSCIDKGFFDYFQSINADFFCIQETKVQKPIFQIDGYYQFWNFCPRKGYSGTAIFTKYKPLNVYYNFNNSDFDVEGRIICLEYDSYYIITIYAPNTQLGIYRLNYRMQWDEEFYNYVTELNNRKPVIICGDFNIASSSLDVSFYNEDESASFVDDQKIEFQNLLDAGFIDSFRYLNPYTNDAFTWWNVGRESKMNNIGWRLDYFLVSEFLRNEIEKAEIHPSVSYSDHCPISLELNILGGKL